MNINFKIESMDARQGTCLVRYTNPYGAITTGAKQLSDFEVEVDVPTGNYLISGAPETEKKVMLSTDNPNDDIVCSVSMVDENGVPVPPSVLPNVIAARYPTQIFESRKALDTASNDYSTVINRDYSAVLELAIRNSETGKLESASEDNIDLALMVQSVKSVT
jgi:hypothetical protein